MPATSKDNELILEAYMGQTVYYMYGLTSRGDNEEFGPHTVQLSKLDEASFRDLAIKVLEKKYQAGEAVRAQWDEWYGIEDGVFTWADDNGWFIYAALDPKSLIAYNQKIQGPGSDEV